MQPLRGTTAGTSDLIINEVRLPRALVGVMVGSMLAMLGAILQGGYPATLRARKDLAGSPENRLADIEQLAVLAARYDSLEKFISDLLLAGDVYGRETLAADDPGRLARLGGELRAVNPKLAPGLQSQLLCRLGEEPCE